MRGTSSIFDTASISWSIDAMRRRGRAFTAIDERNSSSPSTRGSRDELRSKRSLSCCSSASDMNLRYVSTGLRVPPIILSTTLVVSQGTRASFR